MNKTENIKSCSGCGKSTPFFGEIYGRMMKNHHADSYSHMSHAYNRRYANTFNSIRDREYKNFNHFKNKTLIPFYSTFLAVKVIYSALMQKPQMFESTGISLELGSTIDRNSELKKWFIFRVSVSTIPFFGTIINGVLDIISQLGMYLKSRGTKKVENLTTNLRESC